MVREGRKLIIKPISELHRSVPESISEPAIVEYFVEDNHPDRQNDREPRNRHRAAPINLTPTYRESVHTTSQFRWTLAPLNSTKVKVRGKSANGCATARRAPPSDMSQITQLTGGRCAPKITLAARRIGRRKLARLS